MPIRSSIQLNPFTSSYFDLQFQKITPLRQNTLKQIWNSLRFEKIIYDVDSRKISGFIITPTSNKLKGAIIYNRGGSKHIGIINEQQLFVRLAEYANLGYIVLASQYSGSDGSDGKDEFGGMDLEDILALYSIAQERGVSKDSVHMMGASRGGMMTYLALTKVPWIKSALVISAPADVSQSYICRPKLKEFRKDMYDVENESENRKRSALYVCDTFHKSPLCIIHGNKDDKVDVSHSLVLAQKLQEIKFPYELTIFNGADHNYTNQKKRLFNHIEDWFKRNE